MTETSSFNTEDTEKTEDTEGLGSNPEREADCALRARSANQRPFRSNDASVSSVSSAPSVLKCPRRSRRDLRDEFQATCDGDG